MIRLIERSAGAAGVSYALAHQLYGQADAVDLGVATVSSDGMLKAIPALFAVVYPLLARISPAVAQWVKLVWNVFRTKDPERVRMRMLTSEIADYAERTGCLRMQSACNRLMEQL